MGTVSTMVMEDGRTMAMMALYKIIRQLAVIIEVMAVTTILKTVDPNIQPMEGHTSVSTATRVTFLIQQFGFTHATSTEVSTTHKVNVVGPEAVQVTKVTVTSNHSNHLKISLLKLIVQAVPLIHSMVLKKYLSITYVFETIRYYITFAHSF